MKMALTIFNLLLIIIIYINFGFIMKDCIKNFHWLFLDEPNFDHSLSVEDSTKLSIFKLFCIIIFIVFIIFLIIYRKNIWIIGSVLSFIYILTQLFMFGSKKSSPSLLNNYIPEILFFSTLVYFVIVDISFVQRFQFFLTAQVQWISQIYLILFFFTVPFLGMFSLIINLNLLISNILMLFNSKIERFNIEKVEYFFKTGKIKLTFFGKIGYFFKIPFITLINLFYILKIKLVRIFKKILMRLSKYIHDKQVYSIKKMIYISIIFSVSFCYIFIVIYSDLFYDKTIIIYEFFATVMLIPIVYDLITKSKN